MAPTFYIFHYEFRAGTFSKWWKTGYAAMASGWGWDDAAAANKGKGFFNHSANAVISNGPIYCLWETKEGISIDEFQETYWWSHSAWVLNKCINEYLQANR